MRIIPFLTWCLLLFGLRATPAAKIHVNTALLPDSELPDSVFRWSEGTNLDLDGMFLTRVLWPEPAKDSAGA